MMIKGVNALVDAKRASSFNNAIKLFNENARITHDRLTTLENRTEMMAKAIIPVLKDFKEKINSTNKRLMVQYRMMTRAHDRYNTLFRQTQVPMSLFSIKTAPVPLDAETYIGEKREYTQKIPETELIALTEINYVPLTQVQISLCAKIGYMYYCEYVHLLKKHTEHTCMSAIYYDQGSDIKAKQCKTIATSDTIPESKILDASNLLILSNL